MNSRIVKFFVLRIRKLSPTQWDDTSFASSARLGNRNTNWNTQPFAVWTKASKYFSIRISGSPLKSPQLYVFTKLVAVISARVESARSSRISRWVNRSEEHTSE